MGMSDSQSLIPAEIVYRRHYGHDVYLIGVRPARPIARQAGQYLHLSTPGFDPRPYSIAALEDDDTLCFHIRDTGGGFSHHICHNPSAMSALTLEGPHGGMTLEGSMDHLLLMGGGTGIAPMLPLAIAACESGKSVQLYFCVRSMDEAYCLDMIEAVSKLYPYDVFSYAVIAEDTQCTPDRYIFETMNRHLMKTSSLYLSGPEEMVMACARTAMECGMPFEQIRTDYNIHHLIEP